jgi:hypothetical protein
MNRMISNGGSEEEHESGLIWISTIPSTILGLFPS